MGRQTVASGIGKRNRHCPGHEQPSAEYERRQADDATARERRCSPVNGKRQDAEAGVGHERSACQRQQDERGAGDEPRPRDSDSARRDEQREVDEAERHVPPEPGRRSAREKLLDRAHDSVEREGPAPGLLGPAPGGRVVKRPAEVEREGRDRGNGGKRCADRPPAR